MLPANPQISDDPGTPLLSDALLGLVTRRMQLLADPTRVRLLLALKRREACVQQLADELCVAHKTVSQGLNVLYRDGLVSRRRQGSLMMYALADYSACHVIAKAVEGVTAQIEELGELLPN